MSRSNERSLTMSAFVFPTSASSFIRTSVSSASTGVIKSDCPYQSCGVLLKGPQRVMSPGIALVIPPRVQELAPHSHRHLPRVSIFARSVAAWHSQHEDCQPNPEDKRTTRRF